MSTLMNDDLNDVDTSSFSESFIDDVLKNLDPNEENAAYLSSLSPEINDASVLEFLSQHSKDQIPSTTTTQTIAFLPEVQYSNPEPLEIIAQPCYSSLRYRTDYLPTARPIRRDALTTKNSNYKGPAVRIPQRYLNIAEQYYIGVSLATVLHEKTNCCYIHPYELESIDNKDQNDRNNNIVWFPIEDGDLNGFKSFSNIRLVKMKEDELKNYGSLRPLSGYSSNLLDSFVPKSTSGRKIAQEYNLKKSQLVFFIGKKMNINDKFPTILDPCLSLYSDEMVEDTQKETTDNHTSTVLAAASNSPPSCPVYKYAPRRGYIEGDEEVLVFFSKKLEEKNYGKLQVTFACDVSNIGWSTPVAAIDVQVKDQMLSFKTPRFPSIINELIPVSIILQQEKRTLETLRYFYAPKEQCPICQANTMRNPTPAARNNPNKRTKSYLQASSYEETDSLVPIGKSQPEFRQSKSKPESHPTLHSSNFASLPLANTDQTNNNHVQQVLDQVRDRMTLFFTNNDFNLLLRICRPFILKRPELLHQAINDNNSDLVSKFIPMATIDLLQKENELGETALLHAVRVNRIDIVKALLEKENSDQLLDNTNNKEQNIFHLLALNIKSDEILDLLIQHLLKNSFDISEKFDYTDEANETPLQLAIRSNNLSATQHFLKYFDKTVYKTSDDTGDNLIHLAVRYTDLTMLKYLLDEGQLNAQGTQSNSTMTPIELARSMERNDMVEYFTEIYSQPEVDKDGSSEND